MMKKVLVFVLLVFFVCSVVFAKGGGQSEAAATTSPSGPRTIAVWHAGPDSHMRGNIDVFEKKYPDVKVNYNRIQSGNINTANVLLASGTQVDVITLGINALKPRVEAGTFVAVDEFMKQDGMDFSGTFGPTLDSLYKMNDHYYGIPYAIIGRAIFYNKKIFDEAGVPYPTDDWTWDEFREIAKKVTSGSGPNKIYGYLPQYTGTCGWFFPALQALGSNAVYKNNSDRESNFDDPAFKYSLQLLYDMSMVDGSTWPLADFKPLKIDEMPYPMFFQGKVAMYMAYEPSVKYVIDPGFTGENPADFEFGCANIPKLKRGDPISAGYDSSLVSIPVTSKLQRDAWNFMRMLCVDNPDVISKHKGNITARVGLDEATKNTIAQNVFGYPKFDLATGKRVFIDNNPIIFSLYPSITTAYPEIIDMAVNEISNCLLGNTSVDATIATLKRNADQLLNMAR